MKLIHLVAMMPELELTGPGITSEVTDLLTALVGRVGHVDEAVCEHLKASLEAILWHGEPVSRVSCPPVFSKAGEERGRGGEGEAGGSIWSEVLHSKQTRDQTTPVRSPAQRGLS
jgi:hypothetical protein